MRLDKFICKSTTLSKQQAVDKIQQSLVLVNDICINDESTQVHENNTIKLEGKVLTLRDFRYLVFNKQSDTVCSNIDEHYPSLFNQIDIDHKSGLHIAGRLDCDTTGLVLITDDGRWTYNITRPDKHCEKVYRVTLLKPINEEHKQNIINQFKSGILLQGESQLTLPAKLVFIDSNEVLLTITQGKFHQVKRMFNAIKNKVVKLHREKIGEVELDVEQGKWRYLSEDEIKSFN